MEFVRMIVLAALAGIGLGLAGFLLLWFLDKLIIVIDFMVRTWGD